MRKIIYTILILTFFVACSTKKSGVANRTYHRVTSWYNTVFNGNEALEKHLEERRESYRDNFSTIIKVDPIDPFVEGDSYDFFSMESNSINTTQEVKDNLKNLDLQGAVNSLSTSVDRLLGAGDQSDAQGLDRTIEKSKKAIEKHSMLIKGKEYNSMLGEAYLLLGKSYYYKKDPFEALNYLNHMNTTLVKNRKENQAKIIIALTQAQSGNNFEANEVYLKLMKTKMKKRDKKLFTQAYSQFLIDDKKYEEALEMLVLAKKYNKGKYNKGRYNFIQGQLYEELGKEREAWVYYEMAYDKRPSPELEIKSQIAIARLFKGDKSDYDDQIRFLKKLTRNGLYKSRTNELYYAMGLIALKAKDEEAEVNYLKKSIEEIESDPQVRGLAYKGLGDIYFSKPEYIYAGAYYDSAVSRLIDPAMKSKLQAKNKSLKEITSRYYLIKKNDSILTVAKMNPEQKKEYFQKYIDKLKEEEEVQRKKLEKQAQEENNTVFATEVLSKGSTGFDGGSSKSGGKWYFYNNSLKQTGQFDFKRLWGDRALADNWRTSNRTSGLDELKNQLLGQEETKNPRRFEVEFYVDKFPSEEEIGKLKVERDTAELALGIIYYDKLKDLKSATTSLEHLISTPPHDEEITMKAVYNLYRFTKEADPALSKKYADMVTTRYPDSKYAESILNPSIDIFKSKSSEAIRFYEGAYKKYEEGSYEEVKQIAAQALEKYPTDEIIAKFSLLSVFCEARLGNKEAFIEGLQRVAVVFENREEGKKAEELLKFFKEQEQADNQKSENPQDIENPEDQSTDTFLENPIYEQPIEEELNETAIPDRATKPKEKSKGKPKVEIRDLLGEPEE